MLRVRGAIQKPLSNLIGTYLQHYTVRPLHEQVGGDCSQIRIRPARSFNLCNDNGLIVIIGPFSNYFAQLLAIGAEEPKTCGRISEACSFLSCHRHYFDEAYNKYRRNCDCRQQCERASHGTTDPAPHDQMRLPMQLPWATRAPSIPENAGMNIGANAEFCARRPIAIPHTPALYNSGVPIFV